VIASMPEDRARRLHAALIALAAVAACVAVGAGVWAATRPAAAPNSQRSSFTPAEETTAPARAATSSAGDVPTSVPGVPATATPGATPTASPAASATAAFAFHLGQTLYVTDEAASRTVPVAVPEDSYRVSPNGSMVAVVRAKRLVLVTVRSGAVRDVGPAIPVTPVWAPDSESVLFVRETAAGACQVWRALVDGAPVRFVGAGEGMAISPDGRSIALLPEAGTSTAAILRVSRDGAAGTPVPVGGGTPVAAALSNDRVFVSTLSPAGASAIVSAKLNGSDEHRLVGPVPGADKAATYGRLILSPNGKSLAYTTDGDDGYSRVWVVPVSGGSPVQITSRRDGYPLGWTDDGAAILFIEGNAFQGEQTALWRAGLDGQGRKMLVSGARP